MGLPAAQLLAYRCGSLVQPVNLTRHVAEEPHLRQQLSERGSFLGIGSRMPLSREEWYGGKDREEATEDWNERTTSRLKVCL